MKDDRTFLLRRYSDLTDVRALLNFYEYFKPAVASFGLSIFNTSIFFSFFLLLFRSFVPLSIRLINEITIVEFNVIIVWITRKLSESLDNAKGLSTRASNHGFASLMISREDSLTIRSANDTITWYLSNVGYSKRYTWRILREHVRRHVFIYTTVTNRRQSLSVKS